MSRTALETAGRVTMSPLSPVAGFGLHDQALPMGVLRSTTEVCKANLKLEIKGGSSNAEAPPGSSPLVGRRLFKAESAKDQNPAMGGKTNGSENCRTRSA